MLPPTSRALESAVVVLPRAEISAPSFASAPARPPLPPERLVKSRPSISRTFLINTTVVGVLSILLLSLLWFLGEYARYRNEAAALRHEFLLEHKTRLRIEAEQAVSFAEFKKDQTEARLQKLIRDRVNEAHAVATNLYLRHRDQMPPEQVQHLIAEALRPITFNNDRGYYFIIRTNGYCLLLADRPSLEGANMLSARGAEGEWVVRDMLELARSQGEGFYRYTWTKPLETRSGFRKIAYIKLFKPYDFIIGTGEYYEDVISDMKLEVLERFDRFGSDPAVSLTAGRSDGHILAGRSKGLNRWNYVDPSGIHVVQEMVRLAARGGGYLEYLAPGPDGGPPRPRLSYVAGLPEWDWFVAVGLDLGLLHQELESKRAEVGRRLRRITWQIMAILAGLMLLAFLAARRTAVKVRASYEVLSDFLGRAAGEEGNLDPEKMHFVEFRDLAESINRMIAERRRAERDLELFFELSPDIMCIENLAEGFVRVNPGLERTLGYKTGELGPARLAELVHPQDRERYAAAREKLNLGVSVTNLTARFRRRDGWYRWLSWISTPQVEKGLVHSVARDVTDQKKAEIELKTAADIVRAIPDGVYLFDYYSTDRLILAEANPEAQRQAGQSLGKIKGRDIDDLWPEAQSQGLAARLLEVMRLGGEFEEENLSFRENGGETTYLVRAFPVPDRRLCVILEDITEPWRAEEARRESEERYRSLVEKSFDAILIHDGRYLIFANSRAYEMFRYAPGELIGLDFRELSHPDSFPIMRQRAEARMRGEEVPSQYTVKLLRRDGSGFEAEIDAKSITLDGRPAIQTWIRDVSDRKKAEDELRQSEKKYRALFDTISDFVYSHDLEGRIISVNPATYNSLGYTEEEVRGRLVADFMDPRYREAFQKQYIEAIKESGRDSGVLLFLGKDGQKHYVEYRNVLVTEDDGRAYIRGSAREITDRILADREMKSLQAQLLQSQKMEAVGTLASGIAHDFNNILQAISGYLQLLLERRAWDERTEKYLKEADLAVERASDLVQRLLTFSRRVEPEFTSVDLNEKVVHMVKILERTIPKMIGIDLELAENLRAVRADSGQIDRLLMNLGTNARDAMPEGGRLVIATANVYLDENMARSHLEADPGRYVMLRVSDTGQGMDRETAQRIFEPFFTTKGVGRGTGLGLSTVYGIVKSHGGRIFCESEPERGSVFTIYLPALEAAAADEAAGDPEADDDDPSGRETVLVVDDETSILEIARDILEANGYTVLTATGGEEAVALYQAQKAAVDLVVLDLGMPGMGGHQCLKELLAIDPQARVVIASGYSPKGRARSALESGARGFISKPYRLKDLLRQVRRVLDEK